MTNQEAIEQLEKLIDIWKDYETPEIMSYSNALAVAIAALKKQEPMECQDEERTTVEAFGGRKHVLTYKTISCPLCGKRVSVRGTQKNYCQFCGQALKFTEDTE